MSEYYKSIKRKLFIVYEFALKKLKTEKLVQQLFETYRPPTKMKCENTMTASLNEKKEYRLA